LQFHPHEWLVGIQVPATNTQGTHSSELQMPLLDLKIPASHALTLIAETTNVMGNFLSPRRGAYYTNYTSHRCAKSTGGKE